MLDNTLLLTDVYKMGHLEQYPDDTEEVYSYLEARKPGEKTVFFGLQYLLAEYLARPITRDNVEEFLEYYRSILGTVPKTTGSKLYALAGLGYWPLQIKAVPEGTVLDSKNVLMTIRNTVPGFHWCVGFLESMLLKVWNPCTVATCSLKYRQLVEEYAHQTCDDLNHIPFQVHDFGYRGVSSEESAAIAGGSHLLNFYGSDNIMANKFINKYYAPVLARTTLGLSVPASEHSVMCSYGRENELEAFRHMLRTYPTGIVSIVSDTYDLWNVLEKFTEELKDEILNRDGKVVFRPDSGEPEDIICGNIGAEPGSSEYKGALNILWEKFGGTINTKGYKVLNPKVGLIYGDGMYYERFGKVLSTMAKEGFASSNLVIGVGGILLQNHSRDEFGYALKATRIIRSGSKVNIYKDPVTDPGKRSKKGLMQLIKDEGIYMTLDERTERQEGLGELVTVFKNGEIFESYSIEEVRANLEASK
jgi:nicotinamide phosphoribosyltransferase